MLSYLITFLLGALTGAASKYFADKYTDKRRDTEKRTELQNNFLKIAEQMPGLIKEMRDDLLNSESGIIRELFILPNHRVLFNSGGQKYFFYYEDEHENLIHKIKLLENYDFVIEVTHTNTPKYRMSEEFVNCVINTKNKNEKIKL